MCRRFALVLVVAGCGSSTPPPSAPSPAPAETKPAGPSREEVQAQHESEEQAKHDEVVAAHRKIEEEQQDALAATCTEPEPHEKHERCLPSCYVTEPVDVRAAKKVASPAAVDHLLCQAAGESGGFVFADEVEAARLQIRPVRGRFPAAHKKGSWQAEIEKWLAEEGLPKPPRGDVLVVASGWRDVVHPMTKERLHCVTVAHYTRGHALDGCGGAAGVACEATGNAAARGINVVHYRLAEAKRLQSEHKTAECQQAALEAIAVARGMPRWRQYAKLNVEKWKEHAAYRTRFDGTLDEDALFAAAATMGTTAQQIFAACGGPSDAPTTPEQEQSFHTCW